MTKLPIISMVWLSPAKNSTTSVRATGVRVDLLGVAISCVDEHAKGDVVALLALSPRVKHAPGHGDGYHPVILGVYRDDDGRCVDALCYADNLAPYNLDSAQEPCKVGIHLGAGRLGAQRGAASVRARRR